MSVNIPELMPCFRELIATPSVSSIDPSIDQSNVPVINLLANWFSDTGFETEILPVSDNPEKANLIACLGKGEGGLVLSGHTDTVPFNANAWEQDPFELTEREDKLFGLGTTDMKCFFPLILESLRTLDVTRLNRPLYVLATADEESTMSGAIALVNSNRKLGRYALIGEPTNLQPVNMHKGILLEKIRVTGIAGHSSDPSLGASALEGMHAVISELLKWREQMQSEFINPAFKVPYPTLNFGSIHGGDNPNRICAECELAIDLRLLPGMALEEFKQLLKDKVAATVAGTKLKADVDPVFKGVAGMETGADTEIVKVAEELSGETSGAVAFTTEGPYLNAMGMETVILGPGDIDQAHQANEFIYRDKLEPMVEILKNMIGHFCIEGNMHAG